MNLEEVEARIHELSEQVAYHKELYYNGEPEISDAEFDAIEHELQQLEADFPQFATGAADQVGAPVSSTMFSPVRHKTPMLSLDKAHTDEELQKFLDRFPNETLALWPKFDGTSLSLLYEGGKLVRAGTRGDGTTGEDVTDNARTVSGVLEQLPEPIDCEVRGEVVMLKSDWEAFNKANPDKQFANPRNAASGTLRKKGGFSGDGRVLHFYPFDLIVHSGNGTDVSLADRLTQLGYAPERYQEAVAGDVIGYIHQMNDARPGLNYEIDGVVIKLADRAKYEAAGFTGHHPKGAIAFKLAAEIGETELLSVTWQVGKSGIVAPVAEIAPLFLAGTTIRRATLANLSVIAEKDVRVGDRIRIRRAGDVIPEILGPVDVNKRTGKEEIIDAPAGCPSCGGPLIEEGNSRQLRCENTQGCPAQQHRRLIHFASRKAADIEGVSESWLEKFAEAGLLNRPSDIYRLDKDTLMQFDGMGERLAEKMLTAIEQSKNLGLRRAIIGWSIPMSSEGTAKWLALAGYKSVEEVAAASEADLVKIDDIGPVVAQSIVTFFSQPAVQQEINDLRALGVNLDVLPEDEPVKIDASSAGALFGKTVVITGTLTVGRSEFTKLVEAQGAKASGSISAKTDYLIAGDNAGSKLAKAEKLGVAVLTEDQARAMFTS